ncbi:response regulator transcription factor [Vibrio algicola]|uniref:Response regulator n=1 Tax=Vibrio algicola TaxID=2662262 RepID=A0A5Q0TFJ1_9VIBR|nr:response regulator transcription factor [Vibrio algicola]
MTDSISMVIVEDDIKLQTMLKDYFLQQQFVVEVLSNGENITKLIESINPDIIILDLMLPNEDGLSICRRIRQKYLGKIVMLTASDDDFDHVAALEVGADDFITKPIKPRVLLARLRAVLRRNYHLSVENTEHCVFDSLQLDSTCKKCHLNNALISLTDSEFDLLWHLAQSPNTPVSRDILTKQLRGIDYDGIDRTIDNKIVSLRKKLHDDPSSPNKIITVRGKGYLFSASAWE